MARHKAVAKLPLRRLPQYFFDDFDLNQRYRLSHYWIWYCLNLSVEASYCFLWNIECRVLRLASSANKKLSPRHTKSLWNYIKSFDYTQASLQPTIASQHMLIKTLQHLVWLIDFDCIITWQFEFDCFDTCNRQRHAKIHTAKGTPSGHAYVFCLRPKSPHDNCSASSQLENFRFYFSIF